MSTDITDTIGADLRREVLSRYARFYRLEAGNLMLRHPDTLDTQFFLDEQDALGQLRDGKPPQRRGAP